MDIQYHHCNHSMYGKHGKGKSRTFALRVPTKELLLEGIKAYIIGREVSYLMDFGVAKVHPDDNFNKKVGRETALTNLSPVQFNLHSISMYKPGVFELRLKTPSSQYNFMLNVNINKADPLFADAYEDY